jgi:hypothetical protein
MKIFGLACLAAVNPKLLAVDLILMGNRRPRPMFACFLLGGMGLAVSVGLLDVFVLHADAVSAQGSASAGLDLALGVPLLYLRLYDAPRGCWPVAGCNGSSVCSPTREEEDTSWLTKAAAAAGISLSLPGISMSTSPLSRSRPA